MPNYQQSDKIRRLFLHGQPISAAKGEIIIGNEDVPNGVYYINTGFIKVYSVHDNGDEYLHIIYGHGEIFPLIWGYLGVQPPSLFFETISDCVLWRLSREWFERLVKGNLGLSNAMSDQLARQFRIYSDRVDNLEYKKARERIVYRLLYLAGRFGVRNGSDVVIEAPLTHDMFAHSINLARESVSRGMEDLHSENLIENDNHYIRIKNIKALTQQLSRPVSLDDWGLDHL